MTSFALTLQDIRDGRLNAEMTAKFNELIAAVAQTGKGGELTLKLKIKPASRGGDIDKITISDALDVKLPKPERGDDFFWLTDDNELSRNHPRQGNLELRDVSPTPLTMKG